MRKIFGLIALTLFLGLAPTAAQSDDSPLLRMLARIPAAAAAHEYFSYVDYRAVFAARPGAPNITTWQEFAAADGDERTALLGALSGVQSGPASFMHYLYQSGDTPEVVGFDIFAVDRAVEYGQQPETVTVLEGDFDADAVVAAHAARGYTASELGALTLLCSADGCDGMKLNLANRNLANPFGGDLGRSQPVLLGDRLIASSPSSAELDLAAAAINGNADSLASVPDYAAAVEAISAAGTPMQAYFINPSSIMPPSAALAGSVSDPDQLKALLAELERTFVPVPPYNLLVIGDTATASEQIGLVALVYTNPADAEAAAALFPAQLTDTDSLTETRSFGEIFAARGVRAVETSVYPASAGRAVLLLTLRAPLATGDSAASDIFKVLVRSYATRNLSWLATVF